MVDTFSWQTQASVAILRRVFVRGHAGLRQLAAARLCLAPRTIC